MTGEATGRSRTRTSGRLVEADGESSEVSPANAGAGHCQVSGEKEHRAGGAFILRLQWPFVLGLAAFRVRSLGAGSTYSRSVLGESRRLRERGKVA